MTKKDFEVIAKSLKNTRDRLPYINYIEGNKLLMYKALNFTCENLANSLQVTNPRFDSIRFLIACGMAEGIDF